MLAIPGAILAVSTASPLIRFAQRDASSIVIAAYRLLLATAILAPFALGETLKIFQTLKLRQKLALAAAGAFLALHFASWISSLRYTSITSSVVLVTTTPLWVALLSPIFLKEKIAPAAWIGLTLAILGGLIVGTGSQCFFDNGKLNCPQFFQLNDPTSTFGNFLAIAGAWCAAGYLLLGRHIRPFLPLKVYTFMVYGIAGVTLGLAVWVAGERFGGYHPETYLWFLGLAVIPQLIGHSTLNWALKFLSAGYVAIVLLGEPVGTVILSYFLLGEKPTLMEAGGGCLILAGIYVASSLESRSLKNRAAAQEILNGSEANEGNYLG